MKEMYFSVPHGMSEVSFGIADTEGDELFNFYLVFIDSSITNLRQVIVYTDYEDENGSVKESLESNNRRGGQANEFEFDFDVPEYGKVVILISMSESHYDIFVKY